MIIYNIPGFSGVDLNIQNAGDLLNYKKVVGVKYTSYNLYQMEQIKQFNSDLIILNGHDEVFLGGLSMGADGAVGSTYNFMAEKFLSMQQLFENNQIKEAQKIQFNVNKIIKIMIEAGVNPAVKYILKLLGIDCGICRKPFKKLTQDQKRKIKKVIETNL